MANDGVAKELVVSVTWSTLYSAAFSVRESCRMVWARTITGICRVGSSECRTASVSTARSVSNSK